MKRRVETQQFLDEGRARRRCGEGADRIDLRLQHRLHAIAEAMHRRLMAGVQHEDAGRDQLPLGEAALVGLGADELADEIVGSRAAPPLNIAAQERGKLARRRRRAVFGLARSPELIHRDHAMRPVEQARRHFTGRAQ